MQTIVKSLIEAKEAYYDGEPIMTDAEFDALEDKLRSLNPDHEYFKVVGSVQKGKVKHDIRMRSMQKCNTVDHVLKWYERNKYSDHTVMVGELKFDGLSGTLKYVEGKLKYVATRGDGSQGQDITRHAKSITGIQNKLEMAETLEVRGEFIIPIRSKLNTSESPLRSLVAGAINRKESGSDLEEVVFVAYDIVGTYFSNEAQKEKFLLKNGFVYHKYEYLHGFDDVKNWYNLVMETRSDLKFEIDGIILKPFNCETQNNLEDGNEHHPVWATAWKFPAEGQWSVLRSVEYETSRLGKLVPVAVIDPILIGGSRITRCTLNNQKQIESQDIQIGDRVYIERANDVIPKLIRKENGESRSKIETPDCKCGSKVSPKLQGVHLVCTNPNCSERIIGEITFWVKQIGVENFSGSTVRTLFDEGKLKSISDLYELNPTSLQGISGIGESKIKNILSEIQRTKSMGTQEFLSKLGIPSVGLKALEKLQIKSVEAFLKFNDLSYAIGNQIVEWKRDQGNLDLIDRLLKVLDLKSSESVQKSGLKVCATGKAPMKRDELIKLMESSGKYRWIDSVGKDTNLLVTDDPQGDSSKLQKARKLGIEIKTYDEFIKEIK